MAVDYSKMASTTMKTFLGIHKEGTAYQKLVPIKDFPDLGGAPEQVDITSLEDGATTSLLGVQATQTLEFLANYIPANYDLVSGLADGTIRKYCIAFGETGQYGIFTWEGQLSTWVVGGGVNAPREMRISISTSTNVVKAKSQEATFTNTQYTV